MEVQGAPQVLDGEDFWVHFGIADGDHVVLMKTLSLLKEVQRRVSKELVLQINDHVGNFADILKMVTSRGSAWIWASSSVPKDADIDHSQKILELIAQEFAPLFLAAEVELPCLDATKLRDLGLQDKLAIIAILPALAQVARHVAAVEKMSAEVIRGEVASEDIPSSIESQFKALAEKIGWATQVAKRNHAPLLVDVAQMHLKCSELQDAFLNGLVKKFLTEILDMDVVATEVRKHFDKVVSAKTTYEEPWVYALTTTREAKKLCKQWSSFDEQLPQKVLSALERVVVLQWQPKTESPIMDQLKTEKQKEQLSAVKEVVAQLIAAQGAAKPASHPKDRKAMAKRAQGLIDELSVNTTKINSGIMEMLQRRASVAVAAPE